MTKNDQIMARKSLRRHSWLGRLLRDERGFTISVEKVGLIALLIVFLGAVAKPIQTGFGTAVDAAMGSLKNYVTLTGTDT